MVVGQITFPRFSELRCLMMPYIQGDPDSVPLRFRRYSGIIKAMFFKKGDIGFLTIDESVATKGFAHRAAHARFTRALHTEAGLRSYSTVWGGGWGSDDNVHLDADVEVMLANNRDDTCAIWNAKHTDTTRDGDIGHLAKFYPYTKATMMRAGEVSRIGIFTPHESLPVKETFNRQFLRIISSAVHGREPYFTENPLLPGDSI